MAEDILKDIPDEDLPKLAEIYEKYKESAPHAYSTITTGIEWKKKNVHYVKFMSPNDCWKDDGTFFALNSYYCFDIFIYTLDDSGKNVYEALKNTKRLETTYTDRRRLFYSIDDKIHPVILKALKEKNIEYIEVPNYMYAISRDEVLRYNTECPPEVYIKKLDTTDGSTINEVWPHRYKNSEKYVALLIEMNGGYGVFLKHNDELISWALMSMLGQLSNLQTKESYKKRGYGSLIAKYVSNEIAKKGHNPFGTILVQNVNSLNMFQKIGFRKIGSCTYTLFS